jgi:hypothetical protein
VDKGTFLVKCHVSEHFFLLARPAHEFVSSSATALLYSIQQTTDEIETTQHTHTRSQARPWESEVSTTGSQTEFLSGEGIIPDE